MAHIHTIEITNDQQYLIEPTLYIAPSKNGAAYTATLTNFSLVTGATVQAKFAATNDANATLNVNSTGAKEIHYNGAKITASQFKTNHVYTLVYDGTQWQVVGDINTNTWRGIENSLTSDSTSVSLSAAQGKALKGLIDAMDATTPAASGNATAFIDSITQTDGKITSITKKNIPTASTSTAGIIKIGTTANDAAAGNHNHNSLYPLKTSTTVEANKATKLTFSSAFQCTIGVNTSNDGARAYYKASGYGVSAVRITIFELADNPQVKYYIPENEEAIVFCNQGSNIQTLWIVMDAGNLPTITTGLTIPNNPVYIQHHILTELNTYAASTSDISVGWDSSTTIATINGTAIKIKIPKNPNTNTTYTFANGTNGFTVTPSGGTAQTVTVTPSIANNITGSGTANYITKFTGANTIGATGIAIDSNNNLTIPSNLIKFTGLGEGLEITQNNNYFGTNADARIFSIIDSNPGTGSTAVDGGLIIQAVGRVSNTDTIQELLRIRNHNGSADWKTGEFQWKTKDIVVEVGKANKTWDISIAGDAATVNGLTVKTAVPANAVFTDHYAWSDITGKPTKITLTGAVTGNVSLGAGELTLSTSVNHNHNSSYLTAVGYDTTNKKIYYTKNGSNTDIVTVATLRTDMGLSNALHFIGITSTTLSDGSTTSTLTAKSTNSLSKTTGFVDGDVVMDGDQLREYVWSGSAWRLLGITTSTAYTQPASTATNTWIAQVSQGTDGKITATTGSLNTSGTWSGTATKASYPEGFSSRSTNATWGNQTGATVTCWNESGGSIDIRKNNPSSGKVSIKVDGRFYGNEGNNPAMLMSDPNNTSYWGMGNPDGANNVWIRTTSLGIIPFQSGGASAGHGGIGTSSWYFASSYIQNMYGNHIGNVTTSNITHIDGGSVNNGSWTTGATGTAPTATTTDGTTTYSGATIGTSILTLGNNKVGVNSASGVANNAQGYLRLYSSGSAYGELTAYTTSSKTHVHATNGISFPENTINIMFRPGSGSYYTHVSYQTSGNEALVSATQNAVTSFIFVNGESYANIASDRWTKLTGASGAGNAPGLQIKQNCVSIGELIPSGTNPTYKLNVNGISNFKGNMTSTGNFYTSGRHISLINGAETDQFIDFAYAADPTVSTAPGASWRIGALNSGSGDGNYFVIQTGGSATNATTWNNALRLGMNTYDAGFGGNVYPLTNNSKTLGTSSLKWNNVYATTFTGNLTGNATSADSAKWFMNRGGSTVTISDGPWAHGQTGSGGTNAATVWHQRWKQSGLTYTPSGGSATTLTDSGDMVLWLAQSATSNALTVNMAIDGIIYAMGGFKGNLNGQASTVARATFGDSGNGEHNANNIKSNGMWYYTSNGPATTLGASTGDGAIYSQAYSTSWAGQIAQDYRDGALFVRGLNSGTWKNWYAIPKFTTTTGGLGSATQPVYIDTNGELQVCTAYSSASVNYAASAGSVAWDGVEDHPTDLNQFTNGPGYVTSSGVTSITLKAGAGITLDTNNTAITSTGTRTISINGINTSSGSTSKWLNQRGEWTTPPNDDTHHTAYLYAGANNATAHAAVSSGTNIYLCLRENSTQRSAVQIKQGTNMTISSDANGIITFTAKDTTYSNFVKSGTGAAAGLVPSPGTTAGTTKYLREDGTWQVPAYIADTHYTTHLYVNATAGGATSNAATANTTTYMHLYDNSTKRETIQFKGSGATTVTATGGVITISSTDNNTATATDNILDGSNSGTAITYAPYTTTQSKLSFDTSTTAPTRTDRLNLNGFLYATKYNVAGQVTLQYNSTDDSLDFIFA